MSEVSNELMEQVAGTDEFYTDGVICMMYRQAKSKSSQIKILSELTLKSKQAIIEILRRGGVMGDISEGEYKSTVDVMVGLYKSGKSVEEIAGKFNRTKYDVCQNLKRRGMDVEYKPRACRPISADVKEKVCELRVSGMKIADIAKECRVGTNTVIWILREAGINIAKGQFGKYEYNEEAVQKAKEDLRKIKSEAAKKGIALKKERRGKKDAERQ